jgi:hypothetical protein
MVVEEGIAASSRDGDGAWICIIINRIMRRSHLLPFEWLTVAGDCFSRLNIRSGQIILQAGSQ